MSKLRVYAPMRRTSEKVDKARADFRAVYAVVDARSDGRCEFVQIPEWGPVLRCTHQARDHHHLLRPRRSNHHPNLIVHLCRFHHDRTEWPYKRGRLVVGFKGHGIGVRSEFTFAIKFAADKFALSEPKATGSQG
jgi:hypothetical protein